MLNIFLDMSISTIELSGIFTVIEEAGHQPRISLAKLSQNDTRN